jgi:hypothetical protein
MEQNFETTVEVKFGPISAFENDPVVPTLTSMAKLVDDTLDAFEGLILG